MNEVLRLSEICKSYNQGTPGALRILDGLSLTIEAGEMVALVAPSGAGKSTLLHIAGLLDQADSGIVTIAGRDLSRARDALRTQARRSDIGFIYQFHHLLPEFSALENIVLPQLANAKSAQEAEARARALLDQVGLAARAGHRPAEMSGGEQQRVAFCRALANQPKLLLADEPTGNLDPGTSDAVFGVLADLVRSKSGPGALIATHNLELAGRMDRVLRLEAGQIVAA